ncbi:hypothetical protein MCOR02_001053 [Pyricularia oryzae]|nr:hypothetical protein MCOR02_001053 [Pyricularia oryzae]
MSLVPAGPAVSTVDSIAGPIVVRRTQDEIWITLPTSRAVALLSVAPPNAAIPTPFPSSGIACAFLLITTAPVLSASGKVVLLNARTTTLATSLRPGLMAAARTTAVCN